MLIGDDVRRAYEDGRLFAAIPIVEWDAQPRAFFMCAALHDAILQGRASNDPSAQRRWARLEAAMSSFVTGDYVTDALLKQLRPQKYEHWELRSRRPRPSLRVFGRFAEPDVFVGTHVVERSQLGGLWSPQFEHEKLVCEDHWKAAGLSGFFSDPPSFRYDRYITSNASEKVQISK